jgi:hypothetical protein
MIFPNSINIIAAMTSCDSHMSKDQKKIFFKKMTRKSFLLVSGRNSNVNRAELKPYF